MGKKCAAGKLTDEFYAQVSGFLGRLHEMQVKLLGLTLCRVQVGIDYRTPDCPSILQHIAGEESCDSFSEGELLLGKLERLHVECTKIEVMSLAQVEAACRRLDRIEKQVRLFEGSRPEEGTIDMPLLSGDAGDVLEEIAELPFKTAQKFITEQAADPQIAFKKIYVVWRRDEERLAILRAAEAASVESRVPPGPKPY